MIVKPTLTSGHTLRAAAVACLLLLAPGAFAADADTDEWQFHFTPYVWLPTIGGDLNYSVPPTDPADTVDVGPTDWLDLLNAAFLASGGARKGKFSFTGDVVYLGLESDNDVGKGRLGVKLEAETEIDGGAITLVGVTLCTLVTGAI